MVVIDQSATAPPVVRTASPIDPRPSTSQRPFHPYATADKGMAAVVDFDKKHLEARHPGYVDAFHRGDAATMVHILREVHFYTEFESAYRRGVAASLHWVDAQLAKGAP